MSVAEVSVLSRDAAKRGAAHVLDVLRQDILSLALAPGAVLSRQDLQERFRLSSTPIPRCAHEAAGGRAGGCLPQHATVVSPIDVEQARQAQFLRRSIELELVRSLALAPAPALVERLRSLIRQQSVFADLGEYEQFSAADQAFHRTMYEAEGVIDLWHLVRRRSGISTACGACICQGRQDPRNPRRPHRHHRCGRRGRCAAAQEALRDHLSRSLDFVEQLRQSHPEYFSGTDGRPAR